MSTDPAEAKAASTAVHNEQIKRAATALNNIGVASAVTGAIVPLVSRISRSIGLLV